MQRLELICSDAVLGMRSLEAQRFDAVVADPPYSSGGLHRGDRTGSIEAKYTSSRTKRQYREFDGDTRDTRGMLAWCHLWMLECYRVAKPGAYFMTFCDWRQLPLMTDAIQAAGFTWRGIIPWNKGRGARAPHKGYYRHQCEYVVWGTRGHCAKAEHDGPGDGFHEFALAEADHFNAAELVRASQAEAAAEALAAVMPRLVDAKVSQREKIHATGKPRELYRELMRLVAPGGEVLDPFVGSARSGEAALDLGLSFVGIDSDQYWLDDGLARLGPILEARRHGA